MAFSSTINEDGIPEFFGRKKFVSGTFTNGAADEGGDIATGLRRVIAFVVQQTGSAVTTGCPVVNETFPLESGTVTIVTDADADGIWYAIGE